MYCSDDVKELAGAMLKVQAEISPAVKDADNPFAKARYASLNSVVEASRAILLKHGVWLSQYCVPVESGALGLVSKLLHAASGQWQASMMVMPLSKADPQGYGSALTYARRYSLATLVGLVVEDDDGEAACGRSKKSRINKSGKSEAKEASQGKHTDDAESNHDQDLEVGVSQSVEAEEKILNKLPRFDGISYQLIKAHDGRACVIAIGNTSAKKDLLSGNGFKWNPDRKIWWRYADAA